MMRARIVLAAAALLAAGACAPARPRPPAVVVIGIDGLDPELLRGFVERGQMPHFAALMARGALRPLETSIPPQSPVAWSNFITGMDPGGHGIFDFIHRSPATYLPVFSTAMVAEPDRTLRIGDWVLPLAPGRTRLLRKGEAFWQILGRHRVPYTILRVPANFPPAPGRGRALAGMGTPDLAGGYGTFSFYTDDQAFADSAVAGGVIHRVAIEHGQVRAELAGPENTMRRGRPRMTVAFRADLDPRDEVVRVTVGAESFLLAAGQWSDWVRVSFDALGPFKQVSGICRFHLESVRPSFKLYVTPVNIDPRQPALPISAPPGFARWLQERIGDFYTQGIAEDTKALRSGVFDDARFVGQTDQVLDEQWRMFDAVLDGYREGFLFLYVSTIDQSCHVLWRNADAKHPAHAASPGFADRIARLYANMDSLLGVVERRIPADATLIVMSDHGFAPFYKRVHLNTWLHREGYLSLANGATGQGTLMDDAFWRRTRAYALGLNGLYVNVLHREAKGIVRRGGEYDSLVSDLSSRLLALRDPDTGERIVARVYRPGDVYHGPEAAHAPDLIVGYNRGYRSSDESALGILTREWLEPNTDRWSGDHCMDHTLVPGVVLANRPLGVDDPSLLDLPVTILGLYGITRPAQMGGRTLITP